MALGTTLKVGFDAAGVDRGLRGLGSRFGRFGRQVGIGMARQVGARMTDLFGRVLMAAPEAIKETLDWAGGMTDMATQTKMSVAELIRLEEQFRLSGVAAKDSSRVISGFADRLYEARTESESPAREALNRLGFKAYEFKGKTVAESFRMIGERVRDVGGEMEGLESIMGDLFGARIGYSLLRYFNDYAVNTAQAENNVGKMADAFQKSAPAMDQFADGLGRFESWKRSVAGIAIESLMSITGTGGEGADFLFDYLNPEKLRPKIESSLKSILGYADKIMMGDLKITDILKDLGKTFGEGIKEGMGLNTGGLFKALNPFSTSSNERITPELESQTDILKDIRQKIGTAKFA